MTVKERPILFSGPLVRAILDGRKTQTRRVVKLRDATGTYSVFDDDGWPLSADECGQWDRDLCPYGQRGDRLWVRETWWPVSTFDPSPETGAVYRADYLDDPHGPDGEKSPEGKYRSWKPSIHMPRWASRITLEITDVRVERLQDISEADANAEGCNPTWRDTPQEWKGREHALSFMRLWQDINGLGSWDANSWVWAISFKRVPA